VTHSIYTAFFVDRNLEGEVISASIPAGHFLNPKGPSIVVDSDVEHCLKNQEPANKKYRDVVNILYSVLILNRTVNLPARKPF